MSDVVPFPRPQRGPAAPAGFGDVVTWAAWLYYVDELTQAEVAARLGVSRATVANHLQEARRTGIVSIRIDTALVARTELSRALEERFGLAAATVVPSLGGVPAHQRIGVAGAKVLASTLEAGDRVGVAWGRTILSVARAAEPAGVENVTIVQVSGSSSSTDDFAPEFCTTLLANALQVRCANLHAPAVVSSRDLRDRLLAEPMLKRQFALVRSVNKIVFGVGDIGPTSTFAQSEMLDPAELAAIAGEGQAQAVVIGRLIDGSGRPVRSSIEDGIVGISVEELARVPTRLCFAGGPGKREAILAALAGGLATHLVTDSDTATALLAPD